MVRHAPRGRTTAGTIVLLAVLLPSIAAAQRPIHMRQIVMGSDAIVVGVLRGPEPPVSTIEANLRRQGFLHPRETVDVEQWIVPADSKSETIQIDPYDKSLYGRRVLLLLRWTRPGSTTPMDHYYPMWVIDLEDANKLVWELRHLNSPWIPHVTSTTSYPLIDWESRPIKVPTLDPRILEVERILKVASRQTGGR
jgi:hypothetical protein